MVSVIVPAYNVDEYITECLDSVLAQTYPDWELIAVDDGSVDDTGAILERYASRDSRIRCIHQANAGVAAARNRAMEIAQGEWLLFLDGDDTLEADMLEKLLKEAKEEVDIVCCGFTAFSKEHGFEQPRSFLVGDYSMRSMEEKEKLFLQLHDGRIGQSAGRIYTAIGVPWGKLYRAQLLRDHDLSFPHMRLFEDNLFNMYAFTYARVIVYKDMQLYRYRVDHCMSSQLGSEPRLRILEARDAYYERLGEAATPRMQQERFREKLRFLGASLKLCCSNVPFMEARAAARGLCRQPTYTEMLNERGTNVPARYRVILLLARLHLYGALALISRLQAARKGAARRHAEQTEEAGV